MYLDSAVLAGIGTVLLMFVFMGGFAYFIFRDAHKVKPVKQVSPRTQNPKPRDL